MRDALKHPFLVTFSGLDGAGKSTQIDSLLGFLEAHGLRARLLAFWDDVVVLARYREGFVHKVFKSERGIGAPGKPVNRRDKNIRGWHLNLARHGLYLLDAINLRRVLSRAVAPPLSRPGGPALSAVEGPRQGGDFPNSPDVIIMDRYLYDELANLPLASPFTRAFVRFVAALAPRPDVSFVLDADPEAARERKPEYPLDFLRTSRDSYRRLAQMLGMTVIPPSSIPEATNAVEQAFLRAWEKKCGTGLRPVFSENMRAKNTAASDGIVDPHLPLAS